MFDIAMIFSSRYNYVWVHALIVAMTVVIAVYLWFQKPEHFKWVMVVLLFSIYIFILFVKTPTIDSE